MNTNARKVQFFRSCFEADNRSLQLHSFFANKVASSKVLEDAELLTGRTPYIPVADEWGAENLKTLTLYAKEKQLYCCAFFVVGHTYMLNKSLNLVAPLLLYPAEIVEEKEGYYQVQLSSLRPILNPAAIQVLTPRNKDNNAYDVLSEQLPKDYIGFTEAAKLQETLGALFTNLDTSSLSNYPVIASPQEVQNLRKANSFFKDDGQFYLISTLGLGILDKRKSGRGIINELTEIAQKETLAAPLQLLFSDTSTSEPKINIEQLYAPVILNQAQESLIKSSLQNKLSVAVGPPGTGKSFTIAALTVDAISRGKSVLIASNNYQAIEVIAQKLIHDFQLEHALVKTSDKKWKAKVKTYLENILNGIGVKSISRQQRQTLQTTSRKSIEDIKRQEDIIQSRIENEQNWGRKLLKESKYFWHDWQKSWLKKRVQTLAPLWQLYDELQKDLDYKNHLLQRYITSAQHHFLYTALRDNRKELQQFLKALRARTGNLKEERFNQVDFEVLLKALPIWLVSMEDVSQILPLRKELFDLVIFDEATQCNIASAIPILQRGKRAVVAGDPKQLRHISFLSKQRQEQLLEENELEKEDLEGLNYRNKSLLDFALESITNQDQIHFLNEHYRSLPDLIAFSKRKFYDNSLSLMTDTPTAKSYGNLHIHEIGGKRLAKGHNPSEAKAVLALVEGIISEEAELSTNLSQSIGILSPFRDQSDYLRKLIEQNIDLAAIQKHQILVGTPHFFQGEERDIMLLSFALDDASHPSAFRYLSKADVFNVSITRARSVQHVFTSFNPSVLNPNLLLSEYLAFAKEVSQKGEAIKNSLIQDQFMQNVLSEFHTFGCDQIYENYQIAGLDIDIVVVKDGKTYCIDLVGYPGIYQEAFPLERIKMFNRMHIKVFSLPYLLWTIDKTKCIAALKQFLQIEKQVINTSTTTNQAIICA